MLLFFKLQNFSYISSFFGLLFVFLKINKQTVPIAENAAKVVMNSVAWDGSFSDVEPMANVVGDGVDDEMGFGVGVEEDEGLGAMVGVGNIVEVATGVSVGVGKGIASGGIASVVLKMKYRTGAE